MSFDFKISTLRSINLRQKLNEREKIIFIAAMVIFFGGFLRSCWVPSHGAISVIQGQLVQMETEKKRLEGLAGLPSKDSSPQAGGEVMFSSMGSVEDLHGVAERISQAALLGGVRLTGVKFSDLEREGNIVRQKVELHLTGSFTSLGRSLESFESMPIPLIIENFSIMTGDDTLGRITTEIHASLYGMEK